MPHESVSDFYVQQASEARGPEDQPPRRKRRKRLKRALIASGTSLVVLAAALVGGGYLWINHEAGSIQRIHVAALDAKDQPSFRQGSMNVLLTASGYFPGRNVQTGLIELMHLDANGQGGAVISFPANLLVKVPGHGDQRLGVVPQIGGPSLLIRTVERLTNVRINHYSRVTFAGLAQIVGSMGSVNVLVPYPTTSFGFHFHAGINRITRFNALAYVRQVSVGQVTRTALQENLFRAILHKIAIRHYFLRTDWHVLNAVVRAVSVDSDLSNSQLIHLALSLGHLSGNDGVSIDVPTVGPPNAGYTQPVLLDRRIADQLWRAVRTDTVMQFARRYPATVTPIAPG